MSSSDNEWRFTSEDDAAPIHQLMRLVADQAEAGLFIVDELADVEQWCRTSARQFGLLVEDNGRMAAFLLAGFPGLSEDNLGRDWGLADGDLTGVAHLESVVVAPPYRGGGLQRRLVSVAETEALRRGAHHAACTVDPRNRWSLDNFTRLGYQIMARQQKYGGHDRFILAKRLP